MIRNSLFALAAVVGLALAAPAHAQYRVYGGYQPTYSGYYPGGYYYGNTTVVTPAYSGYAVTPGNITYYNNGYTPSYYSQGVYSPYYTNHPYTNYGTFYRGGYYRR